MPNVPPSAHCNSRDMTIMTIDAKATTFTFGTDAADIIDASYLLGDMIDGGAGNDIIKGLDGGDLLLGGIGNDQIFGFGGNDVLDGGAGRDSLFGGSGDDVLRPDTGATGRDTIDGGDGIDTLDYSTSAATRGVRIDLGITTAQATQGAGRDTILNVENVTGTGFADRITGSDAANMLLGGFGDDTLNGGGGDDVLIGGTGNDRVSGGDGNDDISGNTGADILTGGAGFDAFIYRSTGESSTLSGIDRITDYNGAEDVIIVLPLSFVVNVDSTRFIGSGDFTSSGVSEIRVTTDGMVQTVEIDKNGNGGIDMVIEVVGTTLNFDDFLF